MSLEPLSDLLIEPVVRSALAEDLGRAGDITSQACVDPEARLKVRFAVRQDGVIAGLDCARLAMAAMDPALRFSAQRRDGDRV